MCLSMLLSLHNKCNAVEVLGRIQKPGPSPLPAQEGRVAGQGTHVLQAHSSRLKGCILHQLLKELQQQGTAPNLLFSPAILMIIG